MVLPYDSKFFTPGVLNPIADTSSPTNVNKTGDAEVGRSVDGLSKAYSISQQRETLVPGPLKAVVMRVEEKTNQSSFFSFLAKRDDKQVGFVRARIPEEHLALPTPTNLHNGNDISTPEARADQKTIDMYPAFYPKDEIAAGLSLSVGDVIWVELENGNSDSRRGVYTGKVGPLDFSGAYTFDQKTCSVQSKDQLFKENQAAPIENNPNIKKEQLVEISSDPVAFGNRVGANGRSLMMRKDAAEAYAQVKQAVNRVFGYLSVGSSLRSLNDPIVNQPNASKVSMHYLGLAIDLINAGVKSDANPATDQYVIQYSNETKNRFTVWVRTNREGSSFPAQSSWRKLKVLKCSNSSNPPEEVQVEGYFANLTSIFNHFGFSNISTRGTSFQERSSHMMSEWWHFEYRPEYFGPSTVYGDELAKIYTTPEDGGEDSEVWKRRDYIWQGTYFSKA